MFDRTFEAASMAHWDEAAVEAEAALDRLAREDANIMIPRVLRDQQDVTKLIIQSRMHQIWHRIIDRYPRVILWSHIAAGKTQQVAVGRVLFEIGRNPNIRIGLCSATMNRALKVSGNIGQYIDQSEDLRRIFPNLRMASRIWSPQQWTVRRDSIAADPTLTAIGIGSGVLGARYDLLILDDVLDHDNSRTENTRKNTSDYVMSTLFGRLDSGGRAVMIGNAFHPDDLLHTLEQNPLWASFRFPVLDRFGNSTWPEKWPNDLIAEKRIEFGGQEFARQFLCEARSDSESRFKQEWFDAAIARGRTVAAPYMFASGQRPKDQLIVSSIDLGVKQNAGANLTAITTAGYTERGDKTLYGVESGKWTAQEIVLRAIGHHERYGATLVVEDNAAQDFLVQQMRQQAPHIPIHNHTTGRNKHDPKYGIEAMAIGWERGEWTIASKDGVSPEVQVLIRNMLYYNPGVHTPDRLSSFWIGCYFGQTRTQNPPKNMPGLFNR